MSRAQLLRLGLGPGAIEYRLATGQLQPVHTGVYALGHTALGVHGRWRAAVLACGDDAVLSHRSAAALWQLRRTSRTAIDVTTPGRTRRGQSGITLHQVRRLDREDATVHEGIPVTTVARTLLDLGDVLRPQELERAFEEAERLRLLDVAALECVCTRAGRRHALARVRPLLAAYSAAPPTRSELERRFLQLCRDSNLPPPAVNARIGALEVDMLWREQRLVVELDGHAYHRTRGAFERDRIRDATLQLAGFRVLRVTYRRLAEAPRAVAQTVRSLIGPP